MTDEFVRNKLKPLEEWYCDHCGEVIVTAKEGWLEWYRDILPESEFGKEKGFRIVHHDKACMYNAQKLFRENKLTADMHLFNYTGADGLVKLLSKFQYDYVESNEELVEIIRRVHIPYYEEARKYHHLAEQEGYFQGENEVTRYLTNTSKYIINRYK